MAANATDTPTAQLIFRDELVNAGILARSAVDGLYHRSRTFENIVRGVEAAASAAGEGRAEPMLYFPPLMPRSVFELTDYLRSFPDLIGSVDTFVGSDRDHAALLQVADEGGDWTQALTPSEVVLCSAACHPLYPSLTGVMPTGGRTFELQGYCFRHEPSVDPARMQSFRQYEYVYVGEPDGATEHRDSWLDRGQDLLGSLKLPVDRVIANDPFFGRVGRMLAANQKETALKFEIVCPITSDQSPTAIASANCHLDHFGRPFSITTSDGEPAHSACIGFGLERIALALLKTHGLNPDRWPSGVRSRLWP
ncbi:hypothetical protein CLV47_105130 [Antricoccus suffuscus]|uniref:Aminoacyl-transfer RNA synthetases class-II family profile domain-containing protein n=1 Tax=Antricoccus suffuscus TaxID=1629062 RepID=A0A2T1A2E9_9ACTN|nr:amino acid--[acyl-carrier-protein] ligase [Antricoccus suffuscus]PRZ42508.1 hypothetical protein CLV47_105130 [Antricoccus suffuscus]